MITFPTENPLTWIYLKPRWKTRTWETGIS